MRFVRSSKVLAVIFLCLGVAIIVLANQYIPLASWQTVVATIGSTLIGVGVVEWLFQVYAAEQFTESLSRAVLKAIKLPIREFYEDRSQLNPVEKELENIEELWAAWHTGPYRDFEAFFPRGRRGRVLLTKPSSVMIKELEKVGERDANSMVSVIKEVTRKALQNSLEVRWFDGPLCNSLIIANPKKDNAWARIEMLVPKQPPQKRPSFRVGKASSKDLFKIFYCAFEEMWAAGEPPDSPLS